MWNSQHACATAARNTSPWRQREGALLVQHSERKCVDEKNTIRCYWHVVREAWGERATHLVRCPFMFPGHTGSPLKHVTALAQSRCLVHEVFGPLGLPWKVPEVAHFPKPEPRSLKAPRDIAAVPGNCLLAE